jgi:hypothetical protein
VIVRVHSNMRGVSRSDADAVRHLGVRERKSAHQTRAAAGRPGKPGEAAADADEHRPEAPRCMTVTASITEA